MLRRLIEKDSKWNVERNCFCSLLSKAKVKNHKCCLYENKYCATNLIQSVIVLIRRQAGCCYKTTICFVPGGKWRLGSVCSEFAP